MKNSFGSAVKLTIFGESHGAAIGCVIDGLAPGVEVDGGEIKRLLSLRRPAGAVSTARREQDEYKILSGVFEGKTTGTPICIIIENRDVRSEDYGEMKNIMRPSHADYAVRRKYRGYEDFRGGGHQSGRITAALVAAGGILIPALEKKGIFIGSHISRCAGIDDRRFLDVKADIKLLKDRAFAVLDERAGERMQSAIRSAAADGDSVGGVIETAITGVPAGVGEPWFDSVESMLSHAVFSIPAVKGIEFGAGFSLADMRGSAANDPFYFEGDRVRTKKNDSGGINGGVSNGEDIIFRTVFRPTPTISLPQETVNLKTGENTLLEASGRHDPCVVHRARAVVDCVSALVTADLLSLRFGTDWLSL